MFRLDTYRVHKFAALARSFVHRCHVSDAVCSLILFACAIIVAGTYLSAYTDAPTGLESDWLVPAVMLATGHGYTTPEDWQNLTELDDFVNRRSSSLDPATIPESVQSAPLGYIQSTYRYMIATAGISWWLLGFHWKVLVAPLAIFFGLSLVFSYGILRLGCGKLVSVAGAILCTLTPAALATLPNFRDYPKSAFVLGTVFILALMFRGKLRIPQNFAWAALLGLWLGVGIGFRMDLMLFAYVAPAAIFLGLPWRNGISLKVRVLMPLVMIGTFLVPAWPILFTMERETSTSAHHLLAGFALPLESSMGLEGVPYEKLRYFNDSYIFSAVSGHMHSVYGVQDEIVYNSMGYNEAGKALLKDYVRIFPSDFVLRGYASLVQMCRGAPIWRVEGDSLSNGFIDRVAHSTAWFSAHLYRFGIFYSCVAILMVAIYDFRLGVIFVFLYFFLGTYPGLRFESRHFFHLAVLGVWPVAFITSSLVSLVKTIPDHELRLRIMERILCREAWYVAGKRSVSVVGLVLALLVPPRLILGAFQEHTVASMIHTIVHAKLVPLPSNLSSGTAENLGWDIFQTPELFAQPSEVERHWSTRRAYLVVDIATPREVFWLKPVYQTLDPFNRYDRPLLKLEVPRVSPGLVYRLYVPVYEAPDSGPWGSRHFVGLARPTNSNIEILGVYRLEDDSIVSAPIDLLLPLGNSEHALVQSIVSPPPARHVRAVMAARRNLLGNGDYEFPFDEASGIADFTRPQVGSTISVEEDFVPSGSRAVRQTWSGPDASTDPLQLFHAKIAGTVSHLRYELFVRCANTSNSPVCVGIAEIRYDERGAAEIRHIARPLIEISPSTRSGQYSGTFQVPVLGESELIVYTFIRKIDFSDHPEESVVWDDWRLASID